MTTLKDYERVIDQFKFRAKEVFGNHIHSLWQYGSIKTLGISDIDVIVVLQNYERKSFDLSKYERALRMEFPQGTTFDVGSFKLVPQHLAEEIQIMGKLDLLHLDGNKVDFTNFSHQQKEIVIFDILDWLLERITKVSYNLHNPGNRVTLLGDLYSLRHTLNRLNEIVPNSNLAEMISEIYKYRTACLSNSNIDLDLLSNITRKAINISISAFLAMLLYLVDDKKIATGYASDCEEKIEFTINRYFNNTAILGYGIDHVYFPILLNFSIAYLKEMAINGGPRLRSFISSYFDLSDVRPRVLFCGAMGEVFRQ